MLIYPVAEKSGVGKGKTNKEIREWYAEEVARIRVLNEEWIEKGFSVQIRAYKAWEARHNLRLKARSMMGNQKDVEFLQRRDMAKYGNRDGPTFDFLIEKNKKLGLVGDEIYEAIIVESLRVDIETNRGLGLK